MKTCRKHFTLVEILAVSMIIAILAAIGFGSYSYARDKARDAACRSLIKQLEAGLENFKVKYGYYPPSGNEFVSIVVDNTSQPPELWTMTFGSFTIGCKSVPNASSTSYKKDKAAAEQLNAFLRNLDVEAFKKSISGDYIEDPWGGRIYYRAPGSVNRGSFDLISAGPDNVLAFNEKASNAEKYAFTGSREDFLGKHKDTDGEWICDDITNF